MPIHKTFLLWLLYIVCVIFGFAVLLYLGLPQLALHHDHSYLTYGLFIMYALAEALSARQAWRISHEIQIADTLMRWLGHHRLSRAAIQQSHIVFTGKTEHDVDSQFDASSSVIVDHVTLLLMKGDQQQDSILNLTADRLYDRSLIAEFIAGRIVWIGILATILGVIMAFWPMLDGVSIDAMKSSLTAFFGGIAVAFIPTAVSFFFKILLDCNAQIITGGVSTLLDKIAVVSESEILPFIARPTAVITVQR